MELYRLTGDADYGLRVVVPDMAAFDAFYQRLIKVTPLKRVTSRIALETIKSETAYPLA
jgi:Lrp/AsnC family transcriptional regulator